MTFWRSEPGPCSSSLRLCALTPSPHTVLCWQPFWNGKYVHKNPHALPAHTAGVFPVCCSVLPLYLSYMPMSACLCRCEHENVSMPSSTCTCHHAHVRPETITAAAKTHFPAGASCPCMHLLLAPMCTWQAYCMHSPL